MSGNSSNLPPKLPVGGLRLVALGGIKEIGRNMTVFEHSTRGVDAAGC